MKTLTVFGTCPEPIKLAPVMRELRRDPDRVVCRGAGERKSGGAEGHSWLRCPGIRWQVTKR